MLHLKASQKVGPIRQRTLIIGTLWVWRHCCTRSWESVPKAPVHVWYNRDIVNYSWDHSLLSRWMTGTSISLMTKDLSNAKPITFVTFGWTRWVNYHGSLHRIRNSSGVIFWAADGEYFPLFSYTVIGILYTGPVILTGVLGILSNMYGY